MIWTSAIPYFSEDELACKGTGLLKLDIRFAAALPALRAAWNAPLNPTSVCRAPEHNQAVGGHPHSLHLTENPTHKTYGCMAADFAWRSWPKQRQLEFARLAKKLGWAVGLHDAFVHVDRRRDIGRVPVVFLYGSNWTGFQPDEVF